MEDAIENEEKYDRAIFRLEKMADKIEMAKEIALLEYRVEQAVMKWILNWETVQRKKKSMSRIKKD